VPKETVLALDLYAKVEDLLGVKEASPRLYAHYLLFLQSFSFDTLLDVGCGSGDFLFQMQKALSISEVQGIDLSPLMVAKTQAQGIRASSLDLCALEGKYDVITAVFDMLNYLDKDSLKGFLSCVASHLNEGGIFLCDINTRYGLSEVAVGSFIVDDDKRFLSIDSEYSEGIYRSEFTLFEAENSLFRKSQQSIYQYLHKVEEIVTYSGLRLLVEDEVYLYELEEADKYFLVLEK
jgi:predicted TPR repeat methyltransferase